MFGIIQKKGNSKLCGRVICYVKVPKPEPGSGENPLDSLISSDGVLAIQGDYSKTPDFEAFRNNLQQNLPKGLQEILKQILEDEDIKENLDLSKTKKISVNFFPKGNCGLGDFFPVPAQLEPFQSEEVLLSKDADIYFLGEFSSISNAHMFLMGFPIVYQSKYREQIEIERKNEVDALLEEISSKKKAKKSALTILHLEGNLSNYKGNLLDLLSSQILPKIMYSIEERDQEDFNINVNAFCKFMCTYPHKQDVEKMVSILQSINEKKHSSQENLQNIALLCQKMSSLHHEEFENLPAIQKQLDELEQL